MRYILTSIILLLTLTGKAQWCTYKFSFENPDSTFQNHVFIDTADTNNTWQIGIPDKGIFNSAYSLSNAIVTDTANNYPVSDTSRFFIKTFKGYWPFGMVVSFWYKLDIDPGDFGFVEFSLDSGNQWTTLNSAHFDVPDTTWHHFVSNTQFVPGDSMEIYLRFSFVSDSVVSNREGWMVDDICILYWFESSVLGVQEHNLLSVYPNPTDGHIKLASKSVLKEGTIYITNLSGQLVYQTNQIPSTGDLHLTLPDGMYILKYSDSQSTSTQKLIIKH